KNIRAEDLMTTEVISISPDDSIENAAKLMMELKISQLPVIDKGKVLGSISEKTISALIQKFETTEQILEKRIKDVMEEPFPIVPRSCSISVISMLLEDNQAVIVSDKWGKITGIITKADLLKVLQRR
ncbi:inosine-5-monophosphate dehydrogenase, partial [Candidatus Woesearchaeota archaeon]